MTAPTIYDVAQRAGVSISTVSLVTNRPEKVAAATRDRVRAAIEELGFVPKERAVARARQSIGYLGVVAPFTSYPSFAERLAGMLEATADEALQIAVFDHPSAARTAQFLESLPLSRRLDGIVVMSVPLEPPVVRSLRSGRLPAVLVDTVAPGLTSVVTDDAEGGEIVAAALVEQGHRRIAFLGEQQSAPDFESPSRLRLRGLRAGLTAAGLTLPDEDVVLVGPGAPALRQAVRDLLERPDRPTAVFAHCDLFAAAVLGAAADLGLRVPQDLAVIGYDDSEWAEAIGLTTVRQPLRESGRVAARALLRLLADDTTTPMRVSLPAELVRRSTL